MGSPDDPNIMRHRGRPAVLLTRVGNEFYPMNSELIGQNLEITGQLIPFVAPRIHGKKIPMAARGLLTYIPPPCGDFIPMSGVEMPYLLVFTLKPVSYEGSFIGAITEAVPVTDENGNTHSAFLFDIENGPLPTCAQDFPADSPAIKPAQGGPVLLLTGGGNNLFDVNPELIGRRVQIDGLLTVSPAKSKGKPVQPVSGEKIPVLNLRVSKIIPTEQHGK